MSRIELDTKAKCACGSVDVSVTGPTLSMLLCSCRDCRKATGTGHSAVVVMPRKAVVVTGAVTGFTRTANSGSALTRHFCPVCGTPIFATTERAPTITLLPAGLFDEPDWFKPNQLIFARSHLEWDTLAENLPHHETYRDPNGF